MKYYNPITKVVEEWGTDPERLNPEAIKGKTLVPETTPLGTSAIDYSTVTSKTLEPTTGLPYVNPNQIPVYPVAGLGISPLTLTEPEKKAQTTTEELQSLMGQLTGESAYRAEQERTAGMEALTKTQQDLSSRLKTIQNEALAIPLQLQQEAIGRGITAGGLQPIQTAALRQNAIQALSINSLLEASRGNLTLAQDMVDRAVAQKFDPIKEEIAAKSANLDLILKSPAYTVAEKNRAQAQKDIQDAKAAQTAKQEADDKEIKNYAIEAAMKGATPDILQKIQSSRTPEEALRIASSYLGMEFKAEQEEKQFQRTLQEAQYNLSVEKFREDTRQFNEQYALARHKEELAKIDADIKAADAAGKDQIATQEKIEVIQGKISLIDELLTHSGLDSRVGPKWVARTAFDVLDVWGAGQDFAGGVHQLVQKETIDTLINLKARGGTLGALSDQERILLQQAATKIGSWELMDKRGIGKGIWNINESSFKKELETIQRLARKALERAMGTTGLSSTDSGDIKSVYGETSSTMDLLQANPADFY